MGEPGGLSIVLGFSSTHDVLDAEALLGDLGIEVVPVPAPRTLEAGCGMALCVDSADVDRALDFLNRAGIEVIARADVPVA